LRVALALFGVVVHACRTPRVDHGEGINGMRREVTQGTDARLTLARAPQRQRAAYVGVVEQVPTWAGAVFVWSAHERDHLSATVTPEKIAP